jgi:hypothetical protein
MVRRSDEGPGAQRGARRVRAVPTERKPRWRWRWNWLAYVPLVPYLIWLMIRHRSSTVFTAANPGIATGGTIGESKAATLASVDRAGGTVAEYCLLQPNPDRDARLRTAMQWMDESGLAFPVIVKPDVGDQGWGVALIWTGRDMKRYLDCIALAIIVQRYVPGIEVGIFYCRRPGSERGRIVSISQSIHRPAAHAEPCQERLPSNVFCFKSHDAEYRDARHWISPRLEHAVDALGRAIPGFFFGRFDARAASVEALQRGEFTIIELNGVLSEPMQIYDRAFTFADACTTLYRQWGIAFEIGAENRARGAKPVPMREIIMLTAMKIWRLATATRLRSLARMSRRALPPRAADGGVPSYD